MKLAAVLVALAGLGLGTATAQDFSADGSASPFAWAESGEKAQHMEEKASEDSGSRVIGGEVAAEGAWPWQVALMIKGKGVSPETVERSRAIVGFPDSGRGIILMHPNLIDPD